MVIQSCKIFHINTQVSLEDLRDRLSGIELDQEYMIDEETHHLITNVQEISIDAEANTLSAILFYDSPVAIPQRYGEFTYFVRTDKVLFHIIIANRSFLLTFTNKSESEKIASILNRALYEGNLVILKGSISADAIRTFINNNPCTLKICNWAGLDIPGLDKSVLSGADVVRAPDYARYEGHGYKSRIVVKLHQNGKTIGISASGGITFYSPFSIDEMIEFIKSQVFPLIS